MIHYSCDRCKRVLEAGQDQRFEVRIEVQAVLEPPTLNEPEDDRDHLLEVDELLAKIELMEDELEDSGSDFDEPLYQRRRYDLCRECYQKYLRNPLGFEPVSHWGMHDN